LFCQIPETARENRENRTTKAPQNPADPIGFYPTSPQKRGGFLFFGASPQKERKKYARISTDFLGKTE